MAKCRKLDVSTNGMDDIFRKPFEDVDVVVREGFCGLGVSVVATIPGKSGLDVNSRKPSKEAAAVVREGFCGLGEGDKGDVVSSLIELEAMRDEEGMGIEPIVSLGWTQYPGFPSTLFQLQSSASSLHLTFETEEETERYSCG